VTRQTSYCRDWMIEYEDDDEDERQKERGVEVGT
jgi:hypothetical protein